MLVTEIYIELENHKATIRESVDVIRVMHGNIPDPKLLRVYLVILDLKRRHPLGQIQCIYNLVATRVIHNNAIAIQRNQDEF